MAGYAFFLRTSRDPSFEGFFESRFAAKQRRLMRLENFDVVRFLELLRICFGLDSSSAGQRRLPGPRREIFEHTAGSSACSQTASSRHSSTALRSNPSMASPSRPIPQRLSAVNRLYQAPPSNIKGGYRDRHRPK